MKKSTILLSLLLVCATRTIAIVDIWLADALGETEFTTEIGSEKEIYVWVDSHGEEITGFQCFFSFAESSIEPIRYSEDQNGWFEDLQQFEGIIITADNYDDRHPDSPLPGHQLDWVVQTGIGQPRPAYAVNGAICRFKLRFLEDMDSHEVSFDHDNDNQRNTLYWSSGSDEEFPFHETSMFVSVTGIEFGPVPDIYLSSVDQQQSLNLYDYLRQIDGIENEDYMFSWAVVGGGENTVCLLDTLRTENEFFLFFDANTTEVDHVDLQIEASTQGLTSDDILRVYYGDAPDIDDEIADQTPFIYWPEDEQTTFLLDDYVIDLDDPDEDLLWSVISESDTVDMDIDPQTRIATLSAPANWFGIDTLEIRVVDPGGMSDTSIFIAEVLSVNDNPLIDLDDQIDVHPSSATTIDLESISFDIDHSYEQLIWSFEGDTTLFSVWLNNENNEITFSSRPETEMFSQTDFTIRVTDPDDAFDDDTFTLLLNSFPPVWSEFADVVMSVNSNSFLNLDNYLSDLDNLDNEITVWAEGNTRVGVEIDATTHTAHFTSGVVWTGVEEIILFARDPDNNEDIDTLLVAVTQGHIPLATRIPDIIMQTGAMDSSLILDQHVWDLDNIASEMTWEILDSGIFGIDIEQNNQVFITAPPFVPQADLVEYRVEDPDGNIGSDVGVIASIDNSGRPLIFPSREIWMTTFSTISILLDNLVFDLDNLPEELAWSYTQPSMLGLEIANGRVLQISSFAQSGIEIIYLHVEDPDENTADGTVLVHVFEGTAPIVSAFEKRFIIAGESDTLRHLENYVEDTDIGDQITWSFIPPQETPVFIEYIADLEIGVIHTDSDYIGNDEFVAVATDLALMSDSQTIEIQSLENIPPNLDTAILPNPAIPEGYVEIIVMSDEPLRELLAHRASDGVPLSFSSHASEVDGVQVFSNHYLPAEGSETIIIQATDLPDYPEVAGNVTVDSLEFSSGSVSQASIGFASPDNHVWFKYAGSTGELLVIQSSNTENEIAGNNWKLLDVNGSLDYVAVVWERQHGSLQQYSDTGWINIKIRGIGKSMLRAELEPGSLIRLAADDSEYIPETLQLHPAVPNPFNPRTKISFDIHLDGRVRLVVHDLLGREVVVLQDEFLTAGNHSCIWEGQNSSGFSVASGIYFVSLRQHNRRASSKLVLLK
jgi:hypothetical protein